MKIPTLAFTVTDWSAVEPTRHAGETGFALWRSFNIGDLRVRMVEYLPVLEVPGARHSRQARYLTDQCSVPRFSDHNAATTFSSFVRTCTATRFSSGLSIACMDATGSMAATSV